MYKIQTLNAISDVIHEELSAENYLIGKEEPVPEGILVRSADMHERELPESLLAIARAGAGTNNIPIDECTRRGIAVFNTPGANANAVAELVVCGLMLGGRNVSGGIQWAQTLKGQGDAIPKLVEKGKGQFAGPEVRGKTLGVIGLGAIGALVANAAAQGLQMNVLGYDPFISVESAWSLSRAVRHCASMDEIFANADYITVHVPLNDGTRGLIGPANLAKMKDGVHLLNFSRAELADADALTAALESLRDGLPHGSGALHEKCGGHSPFGRVHARKRGKLRTHGRTGAAGISGKRPDPQQRQSARNSSGPQRGHSHSDHSRQRARYGQRHFRRHRRSEDQHQQHGQQEPQGRGRHRARGRKGP